MEQNCIIFFSWQSDLEKCKGLILEALDELKKENKILNIVIDESTRNMPGSPNIVKTIESKIKNANLFIADVSFIGNSNGQKYCNQNVLVEYGYAKHCLGDNHIVLLFEVNQGMITELPFDFNQNRISQFSLNYLGLSGEEKKIAKEKEKARIKTYIERTIALLYSSNELFPAENTILQYPKFEIESNSRGGQVDNMFFELANASAKYVSQLNLEEIYVEDESHTIIQRLDVGGAKFSPKSIQPGGKTTLTVNNSKIENGIAQHPKWIYIILSCFGDDYKKYLFQICGTVKKYNSFEQISWTIGPLRKKK